MLKNNFPGLHQRNQLVLATKNRGYVTSVVDPMVAFDARALNTRKLQLNCKMFTFRFDTMNENVA